jgi:hypothetical protein
VACAGTETRLHYEDNPEAICKVDRTYSLEIVDIHHFRCWQILLQKSFWVGDRKFLTPLMHFTHGEVRDHIVSSEIDHAPP